MLVELPIWIIKHEKKVFLCISEPSAFYRHFVRPIPVLKFCSLNIFKIIFLQEVKTLDELLIIHNDFLETCLKDCMLTTPELLRCLAKLMSGINYKYCDGPKTVPFYGFY